MALRAKGHFRPIAVRRAVSLFAALLSLAALVCFVAYLRRDVVPPDCRDPRTLALVRERLTRRFALPGSVRMDGITMLAGGPLAFRFVCEAELVSPDGAAIGSGKKPGFARYTSTLAAGGTQQEVTVEVLPLLMWQEVR